MSTPGIRTRHDVDQRELQRAYLRGRAEGFHAGERYGIAADRLRWCALGVILGGLLVLLVL